MRVIKNNMTLINFEAWSGAVDTKETILSHNKGNEFDCLIDELYPDGLTETELNNILWFESEQLFDCLQIDEE